MPDVTEGVVDLWAGWVIQLPNPCMTERTPDGAWAAWDESHTIDVQIIEVGGHRLGGSMSPEQMLGQEATVAGEGWIGVVQQLEEPDEHGDAYRYAVTAAAANTLLSCWIAYRDPSGVAWAKAVRAGIVHRG